MVDPQVISHIIWVPML